MSIDNSTLHTAPAKNIEDIEVGNEMKQSYIDYAMSVIAGRALPDARDGLKPVHRRILYTMYSQGLTSSQSHRKSSSIVGETMGNYHPHGDSAIYNALARLSQDFSMRVPLVDGQGNFGSIDGDDPAAMRYTEARMDTLGESLLTDIDKDTVSWETNYDGRMEEPTVLPAAAPNLLINGSSGIAVGMSTNIPPHNVVELRNAISTLIENPQTSVEELLDIVKGPDFPTGGEIIGREGIYDAYTTGRGKIRLRAKYTIDEDKNQIIVKEIPYQTDKSQFVKRIADLVTAEKLEGIRDLRDESDKSGVRIVIELIQSANPQLVENQLINSVFEKTYGIINLAIVDGQPQVLNLKQLLEIYISHRENVILSRTQSELTDAEAEKHLVEGKLIAVEHIEDIIEAITESDSRNEAVSTLQKEFPLSEEQANSIARMQIGSVTNNETADLLDDKKHLSAQIDQYTQILQNTETLNEVISAELMETTKPLETDRKTSISNEVSDVTREDLIPREDCIFVLSQNGYLKRMAHDTFSAQSRDGKGVRALKLHDNDVAHQIEFAETHDTIFFFTDEGRVYSLKGYQVPPAGRNAKGTALINLLDINDSETVTEIFSLNTDSVETPADNSLVLITEQGKVKRSSFTEFESVQSGGKRAITLHKNDIVVQAMLVPDETDNLMLSSTNGRIIRFNTDAVSKIGRTGSGVNGIKLPQNGLVNSAQQVPTDTQTILTISKNGYGKQSEVSAYPLQSRYGMGVIDMKTTERNGDVLQIHTIPDVNSYDLCVLSTTGKLLRVPVSDLSVFDRNAKGYRIMKTADSTVASTAIIPRNEDNSKPNDS